MPFSKIFPSSRSLNSLKNGLESPGKVLEFHLHQRVDTLPRSAWITLLGATPCNQPLYIYCIYTLSNFYSSLNLEVQVSTIQNILRMFLIYNGYRTRNFDPGNYQVNFAKQDYLKYSYFIRVVVLWNKLPREFKTINNLYTFKNKLQVYYKSKLTDYSLPGVF